MRTTLRLVAPLAAVLLLAAACSDDPVVDDGAEETVDDGDDAGAEEPEDDGGDEDAEATEPEDDDDGGDEHAEAVWDGEELAFHGVTCGTLPADDGYEIRGRIDNGGSTNIQARFTADPDASDGDDIVLADETPHRLELFFDEGDTIGDGRAFRADADDLDTLDASVDHVAGTIHLYPEDDTQAPETHPDGAELEFELRCG